MSFSDTFTAGVDAQPFTLSFPFIEESNLEVTLNGVVQTLNTDYTVINQTNDTVTGIGFLSGAAIKFNTPPTTGTVKVSRNTTLALISKFLTGSSIRAKDLNGNFLQNVYVTEELEQNSVLVDGSNALEGILDMGGYKIINLATPTADSDSATKAYVDLNYGGSTESPNVTRWAYTSDGSSETVLTGDMSGAARYGGSLSFTDGNEQVFLNGAFLERNVDYTTDGVGTTITLTVALIRDDIIEVRSYNNLPNYEAVTGTVGTTKWRKVATAGQTLFSGTGDVGGTLSFTPNREQVYVNGILQQHNGVNYTAAGDGLSVTFSSGLLVGDVVDIRAYNNAPSGGPTSINDITLDGNIDLNGYSYYVNGNNVLNQTTLGSTVLNSSLTSVGTIGTGVWQGTAIDATYLDSTLVKTSDTGTVTSTMIQNDTIVNADINSSAGISYAKLGLTNSIVNADINSTAGIVDTKLATISTADKVGLAAIDIDGGTDIGAALVDADLIIVDDGAGGTNRKSEMSRVADYTYSKVSGVVTIAPGGASSIGTLSDITISDGGDITLGTTTGTQIGTATNQLVGFYGTTPVAQPTALTAQDTTITFTAPGTADYAIQDLTSTGSPFGFVTADEGQTVLQVIANLQTRVSELETKLQSLGLLA
jgi:hypothetical protein